MWNTIMALVLFVAMQFMIIMDAQRLRIHQDSVEVYLIDVILSAMQRESSEQARLEVQQLAAKMDRIAADLHESCANATDASVWNTKHIIDLA